MDCSLPVVSDDGDLSWSDGHSPDSDDGQALALPQSPPWLDAISTTSSASASLSSTAMDMANTGQLSPISTGMDIGMDIPGAMVDRGRASAASSLSSAPTMVYSTSSSCTDSWSIGFADPDDVLGPAVDKDTHCGWEGGSDDALAIPKLEPMDEDDFRLDDLKAAPMTPVASSSAPTPAQPKVKRPRGRPRKNPLNPVSNGKVTKGRSKTGCITCRKRKKKCDETKPRCMNCEKNAVVCEGYTEKQLWKSGRERAEEDRRNSLPGITMQPIFNGLETPEDMMFWRHYNEHLSAVLTVEGEHKNAFNDMLVPLATRHQGLMHSILALSSKHLDYDTPYGAALLKRHDDVSRQSLQQRADHHHEKAMERLYDDIRHENKDDPDYKVVLSARYGQMMCLLLEAVAEGNPRGEHRVHLQAYQSLVRECPPEDPAFLGFITEFFQFHVFADELLLIPDAKTPRLADEGWAPIAPIESPRMLGVADGLLKHLCQITSIRHQIRRNIAAQVDPPVDYTSLYRAAAIDAAIREWSPRWPPGDSRDRVTLLYKQMMWVYLFRTIYPPSHSSTSNSAASSSTALTSIPAETLAAPPSAAGPASPPQSAAASCASSPSSRMEAQADDQDDDSSRRRSMADPRSRIITPSAQDSRASPPPIRRPPDHDSRITRAVDESLAILESIKACDPTQTLLLIPCLVLGTAAFAPEQQERIRSAIRTVRGYTGLRNTDRVGELLEAVWRLMDQGDWVRVWDWQGVARRLNVDFLCR